MYRQRLAEIINVLGFVYTKSLDYAEAIRCFEEVQEICESLLEQVTAGPKPVSLLNLLALSHYNIATIHMANRRVRSGPRIPGEIAQIPVRARRRTSIGHEVPGKPRGNL